MLLTDEQLSKLEYTDCDECKNPPIDCRVCDGRVVAEAEHKKTIEYIGEFECLTCSTPGFKHFVIPIKEWKRLNVINR